MCLDLKRGSKVKIANKDIICYKRYKYDLASNTLKSPFQRTIHKFGKQPEVQLGYCKNQYGHIEEGYHSFKYKFWIKLFGILHSYGNLYKCVIPKGSKYYEGTWGDFKSYASNNLIIVKKV